MQVRKTGGQRIKIYSEDDFMDSNKNFYRTVLALVIPMALQNLVNVGIASTDVIMLGRVGEKVLSGASLGSQVQFVMSLILFGITSGASVLVAQYWGKGDVKTIEKVLGIALKFSLTIGAVFTTVTLLFPEALMGILTNDAVVIEEGAKYLQIVAVSYILMAINIVYLNIMRSVERVKISTIVYLTGLIVNVIINAVLIFGKPQMGIRGAAVGTVCAIAIELIMVIVYDRRINDVFKFKLSFFNTRNKALTKDFIKYSGPVILNELMWGLGCSTVTAILGHMGSAAVAANSVTQVVRQLAMVMSFGIANAAAIILGKTIGEGKVELAREYGRKFVIMSVISGFVGSIVILIARPIAMAAMDLTGDAAEYLSLMMFVMAYYVIAQTFNTTMIVGVFRAGGDTKIGLFIDVGCMWCISIFAGFIGAFVLELPVMAVYIILLSDETFKVPISIWRYRTYIWLKNVTVKQEG